MKIRISAENLMKKFEKKIEKILQRKFLKKNINKQTETVADLQIGPTNQGMVRIYITSNSIDIPMDFSPEEARSIADELNASAVLAEKS